MFSLAFTSKTVMVLITRTGWSTGTKLLNIECLNLTIGLGDKSYTYIL